MDSKCEEEGAAALAGEPLLAFIHVPKTGGTSLGVIFQDNRWPMTHIGHPNQAKAFLALPPAEQRLQRAIYGHMPFGIDRLVDRPVTYVTFLRHPVERVLSAYAHNLRFPDSEGADTVLKQGIAWTAQLSNFMCLFLADHDLLEASVDGARPWWNNNPPDFVSRRCLEQAKAHLDQCDFIGLTDTFDEDVRALGDLVGLDIPQTLPREQTGNRLRQEDLTEEEVAAIVAGNRLDMELYEYALALREIWGGPVREAGAAPAPPRNRADSCGTPSPLAGRRSPEPLKWADADLQWRVLPGQTPAGPLPQTFGVPPLAYDYGAATGLLRAARCTLRITVRVSSGKVGLMLAPADGAGQLAPDRVVTPRDGRADVYFSLTPDMAPAMLVARNYDAEGTSGSVTVLRTQYAPPGIRDSSAPDVVTDRGLGRRLLRVLRGRKGSPGSPPSAAD